MSTLQAWLAGWDLKDVFAWPWAWLALPLPLLMRWLPSWRSRSPALRVPYVGRLREIVGAGRGAGTGIGLGGVLAWLAWACLCAALARPQQWGEPQMPPRQARQMMLAVDLSGSMSEPDMRLGGRVVDRLTAAKAVLADFLDRRQGDRVGLLVFGQGAYMLAPLTADLASVREQLRDSVVGLAGRETALGDAIGLAVKRLREQPQGERVLIVLTDGVNTAGVLDPLRAAALARDEHVRIYTVAFGGDGGGFSLFGLPVGGGAEDPVDEDTLGAIARDTGGRFFRARDTAGLARIYAELDRLEPVRSDGPPLRPRIERYAWPLAAALVLGWLAFLWPGRKAA